MAAAVVTLEVVAASGVVLVVAGTEVLDVAEIVLVLVVAGTEVLVVAGTDT